METRAVAKYVRVSPRKARIVINTIRGKSVEDALSSLQFNERAVSEVVYKVVASAAANAQHNFGVRQENLVIKECYVDEGPTLKRYRPRAKGSASPINKRTSHITVVVATREEA